jgi:uncharacterized protein (TIGR02145 family)
VIQGVEEWAKANLIFHISGLYDESKIILAPAGYRNNGDASQNNLGSNGNYWSSSPNSPNAYNLNFNVSNVNPANNNNRANGFSVRCFKNWLLTKKS